MPSNPVTPADLRQKQFKWRRDDAPSASRTLRKVAAASTASLRGPGVSRLRDVTQLEAVSRLQPYKPKSEEEVQHHDIGQWAKPVAEREATPPRRCRTGIREVLIITNLLLVLFSVGALTASALVGGNDAAHAALQKVASDTLDQVLVRLRAQLQGAESVTSDLMRYAYLSDSDFNSTEARLEHTLYFTLTESPAGVTSLHMSLKDDFVGASLAGSADGSEYEIFTSLTGTGSLQVYDMQPCPPLNLSCPLLPPSPVPKRAEPFTLSDEAWYSKAVATPDAAVWSELYLLRVSGQVGMTTARALYALTDPQDLLGTSGVDIALQSFSDSLFAAVASLGSASTTPMFAIVVDSDGYLVGTSEQGARLQKTAAEGCTSACVATSGNNARTCCMILANEHEDDTIRGLAQLLVGHDNSLWTLVDEFYYGSGPTVVLQMRSFNTSDVTRLVLVGVIDKAGLLQHLRDRFGLVIPLLSVGLIVLTALANITTNRLLARPLSSVTRQLLSVARLDLAPPKTNKTRFVEIAEVRDIRRSLYDLQMGVLSFDHYVPHDIVRLLMQEQREAVLGVDETALTILFSDIVDFADMTESMAAEDVVELLSAYLAEMMRIVQQNNGLVDKFIGDILMAFWNAPTPCSGHSAVALRAATQACRRLDELQDEWRARGFPEIRARFGINTGVCLVGNLGSPDRMSFTCIGDSVNLASRLNGLNKVFHTTIITTGEVCDTVRGQFVSRPLDVVAVKGKTKPVTVCEVLAEETACEPAVRSFAAKFERAFGAFLARNFTQAIRLFEECLDMRPDDAATKQHLEAARAYQRNPPPPEWNGVRKMTEK